MGHMGERPRVTSPVREMEILGQEKQCKAAGLGGEREGPQRVVDMKLQALKH